MGKVSDYVDSLKGKEIDPEVVMQTVLQLHNEEMDTASSKIASLEQAGIDKDGIIAARDNDLRAQKAANWDLANRVPVQPKNDNQPETPVDDEPPQLTMDEVLFGKGE